MKQLVKESLNEGFATEEGQKLDRVSSMLGYDDFHEFIGDNPGCYEAIVEWIDQTFAEKLCDEGIDPETLENLGLYGSADKTREFLGLD